jgi:hypothetical protein
VGTDAFVRPARAGERVEPFPKIRNWGAPALRHFMT